MSYAKIICIVHHIGAALLGERLGAGESEKETRRQLSPRNASLEEAYMSLTQDAVEYRSDTAAVPVAAKGANR